MEIWKKINCLKEANGTYYASNLGRIKNQSGQILKFTKDQDGYLKKPFYIGIIDGKKKYEHMRVHRVIALTFISNPEGLDYVHHINKDRSDNRVDNLRWSNKYNLCR